MFGETKNPISASEAKLHFGEILNRAVYGKEPVVITKHGKPIAILVDKEKWEETQGTKEESSFQKNKPSWYIEAQKLRKNILEYRKKYKIKDTACAADLVRQMRDEN